MRKRRSLKTVVDNLVPSAGSTFAALFQPPVERRRDEWESDVTDDLRRLSAKSAVKIDDLPQNAAFVDAVLVATQAALRTSQPLKRQALRNAVLNAALASRPDVTVQQIFLTLTDRFTDRHLLLLQLAQDATKLRRPDGSPLPIHSTASEVLNDAFPEARENAQLYELLWTDLYAARLVRLPRLENGPEGDARTIRRTTTLGDAYLAFITSPLAL